MESKILISFIFGCIFLRLLFVLVALKINKKYLPILGILALFPAVGFMLIYFGVFRRKSGAFGQKVWWNNLRLVHAILYICFSLLAINKSKYSYIPLLIDVLIGFFAFMCHHYPNYTKQFGGENIESFKNRNTLLQKCGLPNSPETNHCFADGTHHTCCDLGPKARNYADKSGNPIGKAAFKASLKMPKNNKITKPWCTCTGSEVCSYYAKKFKDGTKIKFINDPTTENIAENVDPKYETYFKNKFNIMSHRTPGII